MVYIEENVATTKKVRIEDRSQVAAAFGPLIEKGILDDAAQMRREGIARRISDFIRQSQIQ